MSTAPGGITGLDRIAQVKLPGSDLAVSVAWYRRLLDLRPWVEMRAAIYCRLSKNRKGENANVS